MDGIKFENLLWCAPTWPVQLALATMQGLFWKVVTSFLAKLVFKPMVVANEQWIDLNAAKEKKQQSEVPREQTIQNICELLVNLIQHAIGGALCIPVLINGNLGLSFSTAAALARHGALTEVGYEVMDLVTRIYQITLGGPEGKIKNPKALFIGVCIHHFMGISMVLPMNIYYSDNYWYFYLVFLLQFAAAVALGSQQYGFTLDVSNKAGLLKMKIAVTLTFFVMWYSRAIAYVYVIGELLITFWDQSIGFFVAGCVANLAMLMINLIFVCESTEKFKKYISFNFDEEENKDKERRKSGANPKMSVARRVSLDAFIGPMAVKDDEDADFSSSTAHKIARRLTMEAPKGDKAEPLLAK